MSFADFRNSLQQCDVGPEQIALAKDFFSPVFSDDGIAFDKAASSAKLSELASSAESVLGDSDLAKLVVASAAETAFSLQVIERLAELLRAQTSRQSAVFDFVTATAEVEALGAMLVEFVLAADSTSRAKWSGLHYCARSAHEQLAALVVSLSDIAMDENLPTNISGWSAAIQDMTAIANELLGGVSLISPEPIASHIGLN